MRTWTNQLFNVSHLLILPISLIFIIFGIAIVHYQDSQTQPIQPHLVSNYGTDKSGVELQKAYTVPSIASDYTGDNSQQLANNVAVAATPSKSNQTPHQASNNNSSVAINTQTATTRQQSNSNPNQDNSLSSELDIILKNINLNTNQ